jgi:hypothetical protein
MKRLLLLLLSLLALPAFAQADTYPKDISAEVAKHLIVVDSEGRPRRPIVIQTSAGDMAKGEQPDYDIQLVPFSKQEDDFRSHKGLMDEQNAYKVYLDEMMDAIEQSPKNTRVMVIIHGGMNFIKDAVGRACADYQTIQNSSCYYPIFVCWDSNPFSTYADGLVFNREGEYHREFPGVLYGIFTTPLEFIGDLGRAATRAPAVFANQTYGDLQTVMPTAFHEIQRANDRVPYMNESSKDGVAAWVGGKRSIPATTSTPVKGRILAGVGQRDKAPYEYPWRAVSYAATFPFKVATAPLMDALGNKAWDQMSARVEMMFRSDTEYNFDDTKGTAADAKWEYNGGYAPPRGAVAVFIRRLMEFQHKARTAAALKADSDYMKVTLVGHSVGAMVINEIARYCNEQEDCYFPADAKDATGNEVDPYHLYVSDVVFFAAACTTREFESFTVPFIGRRLRQGENVEFYSLSLHPQAELRETEVGDFVPRGSLLVWIDNYFSNPRTFYDKTFGQFDTALLSAQIIPPLLRSHVHLKAFKVGNDVLAPAMPQKHGDFLEMPTAKNPLIRYWTRPFWTPQLPPYPKP